LNETLWANVIEQILQKFTDFLIKLLQYSYNIELTLLWR